MLWQRGVALMGRVKSELAWEEIEREKAKLADMYGEALVDALLVDLQFIRRRHPATATTLNKVVDLLCHGELSHLAGRILAGEEA
jgi:hypothetical protein